MSGKRDWEGLEKVRQAWQLGRVGKDQYFFVIIEKIGKS